MPNVLILGDAGQIARHVITMSAKNRDVRMTLFARHPRSSRRIDLRPRA